MPDATISPAQRIRLVGHRLLAVAILIAAVQVFDPTSPASAETDLEASYTISIAGLPIGTVDATTRFSEFGYAVIIEGMTSGLSRLVSDARATLLGSGRISGKNVYSESYSFDTSQSGFEAHVRMSIRAGEITDLLAVPNLDHVPDRTPLGPEHKRNIVDPVGAFLAVADGSGVSEGQDICNRTIRVFDGWQRFDIALSYEETRLVTGVDEAYDGKLVKCAARYIPVAGHRDNLKATRYMADNKRLEVWYAPILGTPLFVPYRILIGTKYGDLVIASTRFESADTSP